MPRFDATRPLAHGITLLEASAGTGKTYGITSVVLRLLVQDELDVGEILVVTFTEAATAELRDRVRGRLREALAAFEQARRGEALATTDEIIRALVQESVASDALPEACRRLREALQRFDDAAISTIHGFCAGVLREHAFECGAEFDAELLKDTGELLDEVVRDFWAREVATRSPELVRGLVDEGKLSYSLLRELAAKVAADPALRLVPEPGVDDAAVWTAVYARHAAALELCSAGWVQHGERVRALLADGMQQGALAGNRWRVDWLATRCAAMDEWADDPTRPLPDQLRYFAASYVEASAKKGQVAPTHELFDHCAELLAVQEAYVAAVRAELLALKHACAAYVRDEFTRRKRSRRLQTYDDLLRQVHHALHDPTHGDALATALRGRYRAALIDEFQDTDDVQWEIFRRAFVHEELRLVLIGDPKQAIYSFRGADVHTYLRAREEAAAVFDLEQNWRSDGDLVRGVNHLFQRVARPFAGDDILFHPVFSVHPRRLDPASDAAPLQLRFVAREGGLATDQPAKPIDKGVAEPVLPEVVAADIVRFLRSAATIEGRRAGPRDVAVLVRKTKQAHAIQAALRELGVPSVLHGAESVFETREAAELERVLAALLEPSNGWLARAAVGTDLLGLAAAGELAADGAAIGVGDALARLADAEEEWDRWLTRFHEWRDLWARRGFMRAFRTIVDELALPERLLGLHDGERRMTNLLHLAELLHTAAVTERLQPAALLHWLRRQRLVDDRADDARQLRLESDADAVQIVTMHASKGLEYPVVFCPWLWDGTLAHDGDKRHARFYETVDGRQVRRLDVGVEKTPERDEHLARLDDECFAENLRLAYVALTRARHRCVVYWGGFKDTGSSPLGWLLHGPDVADATSVREARTQLRALLAEQDDAALRLVLDQVARESHGTIGIVEAADGPVAAWTPEAGPVPVLEARRWSRTTPLDRDWRVGSFTGLVHGSRGIHAAAEREDDVPEALDDARTSSTAAASDGAEPAHLEGFPSSAKAGILFHEILERHDFAHAAALPALVRDRLFAFGFDGERWSAPAADALQQALDTPLGGDGATVRLRDIAPSRRLNELRFEFPVCGGYGADGAAVTARVLAAALRDHPGGALPAGYADRIATLGFAPLRGFLSGAVDLVAEHAGRWYVLDYKSNRLGPTRDDYRPERVAEAMVEAHYVLQYHLYVLAVHRYLRWRVPDYDYERDFGGVYYLFLRGMRPDSGAARGVFHDRPPLARIEALDRLFAAGGAPA